MTTKDEVNEFIRELSALCGKHGMYITATYDGLAINKYPYVMRGPECLVEISGDITPAGIECQGTTARASVEWAID